MSGIIRQRSAPLQRFTGGLNNYWDQSSIADNELADIVNFEFTTNGALTSRPPIYPETNSGSNIITPVAGQPIDIIGTYTVQDGTRYLVITTTSKTWIYNITTKAYTQVTTFKASDCTQYDNKLVLCATTQSGGYWEAGTFTTVATMPLLGGIELFQNRFFGYGVQNTTTANTIYWSDITTFGPAGQLTSIWSWKDATNNYWYVEIGTGDGQWITAIAQGYNDIVIFRNRSTYRYSYGDDPAYGTMQAMQQDIGAENKWSVAKFENAHFVLSGGILYRYQNWLYYPLNAQRVKMGASTDPSNHRIQHAISIVGRRIITWHNGMLYVYNMDTDTWSRWETASDIIYFVAAPRKTEDTAEQFFYGVSGVLSVTGTSVSEHTLWRIEDIPVSATGSEAFKCSMKTKIYDFDSPVEWKRLFFWGADVQSALPIKALVYPVALPEVQATATWDEISLDYPTERGYFTWDALSQDNVGDAVYGTWDYLEKPSGSIGSIISMPATGLPTRSEIKLNSGLRFRRIYFELYLDCDGTASTSPVQVFSIIPMIGAKAKVAKGAN
jgi:hypothetical protein